MKKILAIIILFSFSNKKMFSQSDNDAAALALFGGIAAAAIAVEEHKENLENIAVSHILSNYPQLSNFRVKVIGSGTGGKKWSDNGTVSFFPFEVTELTNAKPNNEKMILLCFASSGWVNEFGLDMTRLKWDLWDKSKWNNFILSFTNLASPAIIDNNSTLLNKYVKGDKLDEIPSDNIDNIYLEKEFTKSSPSGKKGKTSISYIQYNKTEDLHSIENIKITKEGLTYEKDLIVPFYSLKGDDYLSSEFSNEYKIILNENAIGVFLNETSDFVLTSRPLINKIHSIINNIEE